MSDWRKKLADEIERQARDMKEVSLAAGLNETYVRDALKRNRGKLENLRKVAAVLGHSPEWLTEDTPTPDAHDKGSRGTSFKPNIVPGKDLVGARDFPIFGAAQGGDGNVILSTDPVEYVKRPAILEGVPGAYGMLVSGDSMEPVYEQGDMLLIHPGLPPVRGRDAVFFDHFHGGSIEGNAEAMVKRLVGWNTDEWHLKQFNPPREWSVLKGDWQKCHVVVGSYKRRG